MSRMFHLPSTFFLIYNLVCVSGLTVEEVSLMDDVKYFQLHSDGPAVLKCNYKVEEGDSVRTVTWYHDETLVFTWGPPEPAKVTNSLKEEEISLTRQDGHLEYLAIAMSEAGIYRCEVTTSSGVTAKSPNYQLLIIDVAHVSTNAKYRVVGCDIKFSLDTPAVNPKPDIVCGVWSANYGYILIATKWVATPYYNGSVSYHLEEETFEISQMPLDSTIRCEIKITKIDDSEISLMTIAHNSSEVSERGCHPLEVGEGVLLEYDNERLTCHVEIAPSDVSAPVIARMKCQDGYEPKNPNFVSSVNLICKETRWDISDDLTWDHFDNLFCVKKPTLPPQPPITKEDVVDQMGQKESSSSINGVMTPWIVFSLLGLTLVSGAIWGLRTQAKKHPRYMA